MKADLLLHDGRIYPDTRKPQKFEALAIQGAKILGVGNRQELETFIGPDTKVESLGGRMVLPGLIDAHIHLAGYSNSLKMIDCLTESLDQCLEKIQQMAQSLKPGEWIQGHGWDQNIWGEWPSAVRLDDVAPHNPVYLTARSLHAAVANSAALRLADISNQGQQHKGGSFQRTNDGEFTGVLFEGAMKLVSERIPAPEVDVLAGRILEAQERLWQFGLVGVHDFDGASCFAALQELNNQNRLGLRVLKSIRSEYLESALNLGLRPGFGDNWLRIGNIKLFSDGALGPRTAAMLEPYDDEQENVGVLLLEEEEIHELGYRAAQAGFALAVHAIGDRANQITLRALARLQADFPESNFQLPHRIEHLQLLEVDDLPKAGQLNAIASMQPVHAVSDWDMALAAWGNRCDRSYPWKSILESGATMAFGSDAPVEEPNPFWGIHAAVTRSQRGTTASKSFIPDQRVGLSEALTAYTVGPHLAGANLLGTGTLAPGENADFIILTKDLYETHAAELHFQKPQSVFIDGILRMREY